MEITKECPTCKRNLYAGEGVNCQMDNCNNSIILQDYSKQEYAKVKELRSFLEGINELQKHQPKNEHLAIQIKCIEFEIGKILRLESDKSQL